VTWECTEDASDNVHVGSNVEMVLDIAAEALGLLEEVNAGTVKGALATLDDKGGIWPADCLYRIRLFLAKHRAEEKRIRDPQCYIHGDIVHVGGSKGFMCSCEKEKPAEPSEVVYIKTDKRTHDVIRATVQEMKRNGEI